MEVIPINTNENAASKATLWADRIHAFRESGLSRKVWCQQNGIPLSTLGYWIRKIQSENIETEGISDPVFARLPMEQELVVPIHTVTSPCGQIPSPREKYPGFEVGAGCPVGLMAALLQALKGYA